MKITSFLASAAIVYAPTALAQGTPTSASSTSETSAAAKCTASLVTEICDYPSPGPEFAVASESRESCWRYCNNHQPCEFVIFNAGNPYTGTGTCWLYPGKTYDESAADKDCGNPNLSVYSKPECEGGAPISSTCPATASPSAIAEVCDYPNPPGDCWEGCVASEGVVSCLDYCVEAESCSYVVFYPLNDSKNPYSSGSCWIYPNGTYDKEAAGTCSGDVEQYVYENPCPKPKPSSTSSTGGAATGTGSANGGNPTGTASKSESEENEEKEEGEQGLAPGGFLPNIYLALALALSMALFMW